MNTFRKNAMFLTVGLLTTSAILQAQEASPPADHRIKIILVGDSTVTDTAGWGLGFKQFLDPDRAEGVNVAAGGRSSMSFMLEGRWEKALALKGDYYLIQFGHNNEPGKPGRSTDMPRFVADMMRYVNDTRTMGAKPVLITPLVRRQWAKGSTNQIKSSLSPYANEVKKIAAEQNVPLVDLHARSQELCESLGPTNCLAFSPVKEANGTNTVDYTHLNAQGSTLFARLLIEELVKALPELKRCFRAEPADLSKAAKVFDVRDYGAKGDGRTLDAGAIQRAMDDCGKAGGGIVRFAAEIYLRACLENRP